MFTTRTLRRTTFLRTFATSPQTAVILSAVRTPIGSFNGKLSSLTAPQLGSIAIKEAIARAGVTVKDVDEVLFGNVLSAGVGQAPARQAAVGAGLPYSVVCTTVNKVCASGMKTIMLAAQSVMLGQQHCVVAGGMESMSNAPFYLPKGRKGYGYGHGQVTDAIIKDGLWDAFDDQHMGSCAEVCAETYKISRQDQDNYAIESYRRAAEAHRMGKFKEEIVPVGVPQKAGDLVMISDDEEYNNIKMDKVPLLKSPFKKNGSVTAANASSLNDGASALIIASAEFAKKHNLTPIATILGFADAEKPPVEFTTAPAEAIPKAMRAAGVTAKDVQYYEINEAFSVVAIANNKLLGLDPARVNVNGGAVALGHPIGCSGARIVTSLIHILRQNKANIGVGGICNGGGGASAIVIRRN